MSALPDAVVQNPACGACNGETSFEGEAFTCEDCRLYFHADNFSASFIDADAKPCGSPCDNGWHGDHKIRQGTGYDCGTCQLPAGHDSQCWTGCQSKQLA